VLTLSAQGERRRVNALAGEGPLELRVSGRPWAVTMRTPYASVTEPYRVGGPGENRPE
jgi:formate dehydrogenase assembly factor FdhD